MGQSHKDLRSPDTQLNEPRARQKIQQQLDEALAESFPASDPVSIVTSQAEEDWGTEPPTGSAAEADKPPAADRA